ncbi:MAG: AAA family ATPase [Candidatus Ratteibacteria bacterium]|nr:AAA family ATPase [Candidatus Ratteibacteria bacterium]
MIEVIKLFKYKGITELELKDLQHINVICGQNNSGKSSILESIATKEHRALGTKIKESDINRLDSHFAKFADNWNSPHPETLKTWFKKFIPSEINTIIWEDPTSVAKKVGEYVDNFNKYTGNRHGPLNFKQFLESLLKKHQEEFKPLLIPPKRKLDYEINIDTSTQPLPEGSQLLNRLFFLKNRDPESKEYQIYKEIYDKFSQITNGYYFNVVPEKNNKIYVVFADAKKKWIRGDACGLGLRDVLIILSFIIDFDYNFIMIEEPENHIHPDMQRRLLQFLESVKDKQFLMATHSNVFLDPTYTDKIYFVERTDTVHIYDETNRAYILRNLGYSIVDNLISDLVILTEGPSDASAIEEICQKIGFWESYNIKIWPMGGDIMSQLDLSTFTSNVIKNKVIALIDSDTGSKKERERFKENCKEMGIECIQLERYAIENYIPLKVIQKFPEFKIPAEVKEIKTNEKVEKQIGINLKKNLRKLIKATDIEDIKNTDLFKFCEKVAELVKK